METSKEKAKELVDKFTNVKSLQDFGGMYNPIAKECAKIAVQEIINSEPLSPSNVDWDDCGGTHKYYYEAEREEANIFWNDVLKKIDNV